MVHIRSKEIRAILDGRRNTITTSHSSTTPHSSDKPTQKQTSSINTLLRGSPYRLICNDALRALSAIPSDSVNCIITSPPYWQQREYDVPTLHKSQLIGCESTPERYITRLGAIFDEAKRILKKDGSLWLNMGDKYQDKCMLGLPWMTAFRLIKDGWILRNDVIWDKRRGMQNVSDRLHTTHEYIFHMVKSKRYYYDRKSILTTESTRSANEQSKRSGTTPTGTKYRSMIQTSTALSMVEKQNALVALDNALADLRSGRISDFRIIIRGQRVCHGDRPSKSGRSRELTDRGFFVIRGGSGGRTPNTIWSVASENGHKSTDHYAIFPTELLNVPIRATCPPDGLVLDPFVGTGSTVVAALTTGRRAIGIDLSHTYVRQAESRVREMLGKPA